VTPFSSALSGRKSQLSQSGSSASLPRLRCHDTLLGLPEFATVAALDHYTLRKRSAVGDFVALRANTRRYVNELMPDLEDLGRLIESPNAVNGTLSMDDVRVLPLLRSVAVVKGLRFPRRVRDYFESMMTRIGFEPLPVI
jgi:glutaredoxin 2